MMTLKDIKVSKNPIPVQNAMWLRPLGGFKFKLYYPQGGTWTEITTSGGEDPHELDEIERRLAAVENELSALSKQVESCRLMQINDREEFLRLLNLQQVKISQVQTSVNRLYGSTDITTLVLIRMFPTSETMVEITDPSKYGIDQIYIDAINKETISEINFVIGEKESKYDASYETNSWSLGPGRPHITSSILNGLQEDTTAIKTVRWIARIQANVQHQVYAYYAHSMSYERTSDTILLPKFYKELFFDGLTERHEVDTFLTPEQMNSYGLTLETVQRMGAMEEGQAFLGKEAIPYTVTGEIEDTGGIMYYTITMVCIDTDYNDQKIFEITAEVTDSEFTEVEVIYREEAIPYDDEEE